MMSVVFAFKKKFGKSPLIPEEKECYETRTSEKKKRIIFLYE